jgi:hypothetical protein
MTESIAVILCPDVCHRRGGGGALEALEGNKRPVASWRETHHALTLEICVEVDDGHASMCSGIMLKNNDTSAK